MKEKRDYSPEEYWSKVGGRINERSSNRAVAGDTDALSVYIRRKFLKKLLPAIPVEGKRCLEIGCGPGGNLSTLATKGPKRLAGVDISQTMLDLARQSNPSKEVELFKIDGQTLPFADNEFDNVFSVTVIQHNYAEMAKNLVQEMSRVSNESIFLFEDVSPQATEVYSYVVRTVADYEKLFEEKNFYLVGVEYLATSFSEKAVARFRRLSGQGKELEEGAPRKGLAHSIERIIVLFASILDECIPCNSGLAKMEFKKRI